MIGFEFKNKTPFEGRNHAKIIIATNNLPPSTDKSIGFYRRWCIVDFPNQFSEEKDILEEIPKEEYESLALKSMTILKDLLQNKKFSNEGTIEERQKKYEEKSNFFDKFFNEYIEEDYDSFITINDFTKKLDHFCIGNKQRTLSPKTVMEKMKEKGIAQDRKRIDWFEGNNKLSKQVRAWAGIKWK